jgi:hypothetical protein
MVHLPQTVYLSYVKISTICKGTKMSFQLSLVTQECHRVCAKWFLCLRYIWHKLSTNRVRPKWFMSLWYVWREPCTYLAPTLTTSPNVPKHDFTWPTHLGVPLGASKTFYEPMVRLTQTAQLSCVTFSTKPCTYLAPILTLSPNGGKRDSRWPTSPRISIGCIKTDFRANGAFGANHTPILHQD